VCFLLLHPGAFQSKNLHRLYFSMKRQRREKFMTRKVLSICACILLLAACAETSKTQKGAIYGSAGGAAAGAVAGQAIGHNTKSTLIGAAIGAAVGGLGGAGIGKMMDN